MPHTRQCPGTHAHPHSGGSPGDSCTCTSRRCSGTRGHRDQGVGGTRPHRCSEFLPRERRGKCKNQLCVCLSKQSSKSIYHSFPKVAANGEPHSIGQGISMGTSWSQPFHCNTLPLIGRYYPIDKWSSSRRLIEVIDWHWFLHLDALPAGLA